VILTTKDKLVNIYYILSMNGLEASTIQCPYCWEMIEITVDCSVNSQDYVEDCEVCCQPIVMQVNISLTGAPEVRVERES